MKIRKFMLLYAIALAIMGQSLANAETEDGTVELLRGDEEEVELVMEGTEDIYALYGVLMGDADYVTMRKPWKKVTEGYQALVPDEEGEQGMLLLSRLGFSKGDGLHLRIRVQGKRIGTATVTLATPHYATAAGTWLEGAEFPQITVKVLPNPLEILVSGEEGNGGWYWKKPVVSVTDKDAAEIFYSLNEEGEQKYTAPFLVPDGEWNITVRTDDGYGYKKEETVTVLVDTKNPVIAASKRSADWQKESIVVVLRAADGTSGVSSANWAVSGSSETAGTYESFTDSTTCILEEDGIWYLHVFAEDVAGNTTEWVYGPYQKDSVAPEITIGNITQNESITDGIVPETGFYDFSGIAKAEYYLDGKAWELSEITGRGKHTLTVAATDLAGNRAEESVEFTIYDSLEVFCQAEDSHYTGMTLFTASVAYDGEPLAGRNVTFYVNGENVGEAVTDRQGRAILPYLVWLSPQEAELTVEVAQEDENYYAKTQAETTFFIAPENAVAVYTGDLFTRNGETLGMRLEVAELPDLQAGDITKAVFDITLSFVEEDGSRTAVDVRQLSPEENGVLIWEGSYGTGLYELCISFAENSWYQGNELILYPGVYEVQATWEEGAGKLLIDLPPVGIRLLATLAFLPVPDLSAEVTVRIPGTGIVLTENEMDGWNLTEEGLVLTGKAYNARTGEVYRYRVKAEFSYGLLVTKLEAYVWEGGEPEEGTGDGTTGDGTGEGTGEETDPDQPVYEFQWELKELTD